MEVTGVLPIITISQDFRASWTFVLAHWLVTVCPLSKIPVAIRLKLRNSCWNSLSQHGPTSMLRLGGVPTGWGMWLPRWSSTSEVSAYLEPMGFPGIPYHLVMQTTPLFLFLFDFSLPLKAHFCSEGIHHRHAFEHLRVSRKLAVAS